MLNIAAYVDQNHNLKISEVEPKDSGVHVCLAMLPFAKIAVPVEIYALAVISRIPVDVNAGKSISLHCNNFLLTQLYVIPYNIN